MKSALIIDGNYLNKYTYNTRIDMVQLKKVLEEDCGHKFREAHYVCSKSVDAVPFHRFLRASEPNGPRMRVHEHEKRSTEVSCSECGHEINYDIVGGIDVHITVLAMKMYMNDSVDRIVLLAGSGNLEPLVTFLMDNGIEVVIVGDEGSVSTLLHPYVTKLLWLNDLNIQV